VKALLPLALVACNTATPPATIPKNTPEPVSAPATAAPSISFVDDHFELHGLPAIARDRSIVVLPQIDGDGGRGYPNLRIDLRSPSDTPIGKDVVMFSNDYEALVVDGSPTKELARRLEKTNARLRELHAKHVLVEMKRAEELDHKPDPQGGAGWQATEFVIDVTTQIRYANGVLEIVFRADRSLSFERNWKAPPVSRGPSEPPCENPEYLKTVYYAEGISAIVAEVAYQGTDTCWEPGNELHVISW
jgi:hypothetical protein